VGGKGMKWLSNLFCRHNYIEFSNGIVLIEPYCYKCGKKEPKRKYTTFTKTAIALHKAEQKLKISSFRDDPE
jgi:hypothetical protein